MVVVEWPYKVSQFMPKDYLLVQIKKISEFEREFTMTCIGMPCRRAVQYI